MTRTEEQVFDNQANSYQIRIVTRFGSDKSQDETWVSMGTFVRAIRGDHSNIEHLAKEIGKAVTSILIQRAHYNEDVTL